MERAALGLWVGDKTGLVFDDEGFRQVLGNCGKPVFVLKFEGKLAMSNGGEAVIAPESAAMDEDCSPLLAMVPALPVPSLGDRSFLQDFRVEYPIVAGAMYHGITSVDMVVAMAENGMLGMFGAGGLGLPVTEKALLTLKERLGDLPFGCNLLHSPQEPALEDGTIDLLLKHEVRYASASAYIELTLPIVRYRLAGIRRLEDGTVYAPNRVIGKVSRIEVATRYFSPPPEKHVATLVAQGILTAQQGEMAKEIPMGQDIIAEADSGGHTDNQPFVTMVPTMIALRDEMQAKYNYPVRLRVGVGGGIGNPAAAVAAFSMGAAFLVTGSVNQSCLEAGTSQMVRELLCQTQQADTTMAPAADMFEMGVQVQVLKRGTMFAMRAKKLYEVYRECASIEEISASDRANMEKTMFKTTLEDIWNQTQAYFAERDQRQLDKALKDPKYKMALIFRWYLGQTSHWATSGEAVRRIDFQVQCGPSMGAFNEWAKGTILEKAPERTVSLVSMNLLHGASYLSRMRNLAFQGVDISSKLSVAKPMSAEELKALVV